MTIDLSVTPAYVGECIGDKHEVYYIEIGIVEKGIPMMMVHHGGVVNGGTKVGFFRDDGLIEVSIERVFASRHMAESFLLRNRERYRGLVKNLASIPVSLGYSSASYLNDDGSVVGADGLDEKLKIRVNINKVSDGLSHGGLPDRLRMDPVDYDRTAEKIEEMRKESIETGTPVFTSDQTDDEE
jgi:hypothetical protein